MQIFADCVDDKGRPIALTEKLSVAEIKSRLDKVESKIFWISDTDDNQLLELVSYINGMQARYDTKVDDSGNVTQIPVRTDLFGFNIMDKTNSFSNGEVNNVSYINCNAFSCGGSNIWATGFCVEGIKKVNNITYENCLADDNMESGFHFEDAVNTTNIVYTKCCDYTIYCIIFLYKKKHD